MLVTSPARGDVVMKVTTTKDVVDPNDGKCSLREAVTAANSDGESGPALGECPAGSGVETDVIKLGKEKTYVLSLPGDDDTNVAGDLDIDAPVTIQGSRRTTIRQTTQDRVIDVQNVLDVTIDRVKITGGHAPDGTPSSIAGEHGGAIRNEGDLVITRSKIVGNTAGHGATDQGPVGAGGAGGGIWNSGDLVIERSKVMDNAAGDGAAAGLSDTPGTSPEGGAGGHGGGLYNSAGTITISRSKVSNNTSGDGGAGAADPSSPTPGGEGGYGGGIAATTMGPTQTDVEFSTIAGNTAGTGGPGADGPNDTDGAVGGDGGRGGGLAIGGILDMASSTVLANTSGAGGAGGEGGADGGGGGGHGGKGGDAGDGGGLSLASATIGYSTVSQNTNAVGGPGGAAGAVGKEAGQNGMTGDGAGIFANASTVDILNSTVSGNTTSGLGGGILGTDTASISLDNATVAFNSASEGGGLLHIAGSFTLENSLVARNQAFTSGPDCFSLTGFISDGNNLIGDITDCPGFAGGLGDVLDVDARIAKLEKNGGPTKTHALRRGSPAINAGDGSTCAIDDQRGKVRGPLCDIGAFEKKVGK